MKKQLIRYSILLALLACIVSLLLFIRDGHDMNWIFFSLLVVLPSIISNCIMSLFTDLPFLLKWKYLAWKTAFHYKAAFIVVSIVVLLIQLLLLASCYTAINKGWDVELFISFGFYNLVAFISNIYFLYGLTEPVSKRQA